MSTWLIAVPEPALAPVIPPVIAPKDHAKVLFALADRLMSVPLPLQIVFVERFVTMGNGLTVTVIVNAFPLQDPEEEMGVIIYCTVPAAALLGFVST